MRNEAHERAQWRARNCRRQQRRRGYISPYHESPVDLDKYGDDMEMLDADAACWVNAYDQCKVVEPKEQQKTGPRPLVSGCAANFELFGDPRKTAFAN